MLKFNFHVITHRFNTTWELYGSLGEHPRIILYIQNYMSHVQYGCLIFVMPCSTKLNLIFNC